MTTRVFAEWHGAELNSDVRDIGIKVQDADVIIPWCVENNIDIQRVNRGFGIDVWRIKDEQQRMMFLLKFGDLCQ